MASCTGCKKRTTSYCYIHKSSICDDCIIAPPVQPYDSDKILQHDANDVIGNYFDYLADPSYIYPPVCTICMSNIPNDAQSMIRLVCKCLYHTQCIYNNLHQQLSQCNSNVELLLCSSCGSHIIDMKSYKYKSKLRLYVNAFLHALMNDISLDELYAYIESHSTTDMLANNSNTTINPQLITPKQFNTSHIYNTNQPNNSVVENHLIDSTPSTNTGTTLPYTNQFDMNDSFGDQYNINNHNYNSTNNVMTITTQYPIDTTLNIDRHSNTYNPLQNLKKLSHSHNNHTIDINDDSTAKYNKQSSYRNMMQRRRILIVIGIMLLVAIIYLCTTPTALKSIRRRIGQ